MESPRQLMYYSLSYSPDHSEHGFWRPMHLRREASYAGRRTAYYSNLSNRVLFSDMLCMKTYPLELRHRVIRAVDNRIGTKKEIAETFSVSTSWIRKLLRRRKETGTLEPSACTQGRKPAFNGKDLEQLNKYVRENPDSTLEQIREHFSGTVNCSIVAVHNALKRLDWHYKKNRYERVSRTEKM
jgi:transposase